MKQLQGSRNHTKTSEVKGVQFFHELVLSGRILTWRTRCYVLSRAMVIALVPWQHASLLKEVLQVLQDLQVLPCGLVVQNCFPVKQI